MGFVYCPGLDLTAKAFVHDSHGLNTPICEFGKDKATFPSVIPAVVTFSLHFLFPFAGVGGEYFDCV